MSLRTLTFLSSGVLEYTASNGSGSVVIAAWGAGGHGNASGNGGSGGAFAYTSSILNTGSLQIVVGTATSTNGGSSYVTASGVILVRAAGGQRDGTVTSQAALNTGSVKWTGGLGGSNATGYSEYNGSGGGAAANFSGSGAAGNAPGVYSDRLLSSFYYRTQEAAQGGTGILSAGSGGAGAYYAAWSGPAGIVAAGAGAVPGGGGGGGYDYGADQSGAGGNGQVSIICEY